MANQTDKATIDLVINGRQSETSLKTIATAATNARKALYQMAETDPGYRKQQRELESLMRAQSQRIVKIHQEKTAWQKFTTSAGSITAGITGANVITAGLGLIQDGIRAAREEYKAFNAASQDLSAVTGATGTDLEFLNKQAKLTGPAFGKTGAEMLEAYKLMASAKPELLDQKELLVETTKAALTLSRAGKIDLADATKVTAESLNQFGQGADQANRFINVIAAGAKEGSAEINEMGIALKNSGTVAASQNVTFEETNATLQSLSTIALKGGEAGTQLRNVLLTLGSGSDETNPKVVGLEKALENLAKKNLSTAEMTKLFGKENITAAQHIVTHREEIARLTDKVTGTSEAFSQAAKNNDTYEQKVAVFDATLSKLGVTIGSQIIPLFTGMMEGVVSVANWFDQQLTPAAETATQAFEDQRAKVQDLTKNLSPLLARHDELKNKTVLTKDEQIELRNIVGQVADIVPSAVTEFDKYGHALGINTEKAKEFIRTQKLLLKVKNEDAIAEQESALNDDEDKLTANKKYRQKATSGAWDVIQATEPELKALDKANIELGEKIAGRKALLAQLRGENLEVPKSKPASITPSAPTGSGGGSSGNNDDDEETKEEKKARLKRDRTTRERDNKIKANEQAKLAIEEMDVKAIKDDEQREIAQAKFRADKEREQVRTSKANAELKATWIKGIDDALTVEQGKIQEKYTEKRREEEEKQMNNLLKSVEAELELKKQAKLAEIQLMVANGELTKEEGEERKLNAEEAFLNAKLLLHEAHYDALHDLFDKDKKRQAEIDLEKKTSKAQISGEITQNEADQSTARKAITVGEATKSRETAEQQKKDAREVYQAKKQIFDDSVVVLKSFFKENTVIYKAGMIAQQAWALGEVAVNYSRAVMGAIASAAGVPFPGNLLAIAKGIAIPTLSAAAAVANIRKQKFDAPAFAEGGFTDEQPAGFTSGPTYYAKKNFMAGEAGPEWIMSAPMLQNPVMANLAGALQAIQQSGAYRTMSLAPQAGAAPGQNQPGGGGMSNEIAMAILDQLVKNNSKMEDVAKRPINYNYFKVRDQEDYLDEIGVETTL